MSAHKWIDRICCVALVVALLITGLFINGEALGIQAAEKVMGYENRLFDASKVHTIDIVMNDWDEFIETCENEEYAVCNVLIDGELYTNIGIRAKGNTSLSSVSQMNSDRYSFKIEFDQYDTTKSYYGLDKLSLNNLIQDNTYMKDFLVYQMMNKFGVSAPLCSYVYITVNGEDWGLYLAVEGVEDAFLQRNYGTDYGELYKPDSMSFGGGRGNGMDFNFEDLDFENLENFDFEQMSQNNFGNVNEGSAQENMPQGNMQMPTDGNMPQGNMQMPSFENIPQGNGQMPSFENMPQGNGQMPSFKNMPQGNGQMPSFENMPQGNTQISSSESISESDRKMPSGGMFGGMGMGSSDVKLQYIDDNESSYSNIFNNAKTEITESDKERLIASLKELSEGENIENVVDIEKVIRYFVVHNFVVNGDSYTGSMIHNYYLYEEDGQLEMIPWDYNLAYGTFMGSNAQGSVNEPIDSPVSGGTQDRPMIDWIFSNKIYTEQYHELFSLFINEMFESGCFTQLVDNTIELIAPYVEKDPSKFCTYEEFEVGSETIKQFCLLRAQSVSGQLGGIIPSTSEGQEADNTTLITASSINISAMGTMGNSMGGGFDFGGRSSRGESSSSGSQSEKPIQDFNKMQNQSSTENTTESQNKNEVENKNDNSIPSFNGNQQQENQGQNPIKDFNGIQGETSTENSNETQNGSSSNRGNRGNMSNMQFPEGMQMPNGAGTVGNMQTFNIEQIVLLGASVVVLLIGLVVATKWKR